eukprot:scaffold94240_cov69-Phaeocystis_antarctica.AAC.9
MHGRLRCLLDVELIVHCLLILHNKTAGRKPLRLLFSRWQHDTTLVEVRVGDVRSVQEVDERVNRPKLAQRNVEVLVQAVDSVREVPHRSPQEHGDAQRVRSLDVARGDRFRRQRVHCTPGEGQYRQGHRSPGANEEKNVPKRQLIKQRTRE